MKNSFVFFLLLLGMGTACTDTSSSRYTGRSMEYSLFKASDFDLSGTLEVRELIGGALELAIDLNGISGSSDVSYPGHLHFGNYQTPDAPIAHMLTPVNAESLESVTLLGTLSDGETLSFDQFLVFDGHVKVHLASEGPDYEVILVAGNVGSAVEESVFDPSKMAICGNNF